MLSEYFWIAVPLCIMVIGWLLAEHEPSVIGILTRIALALMSVAFVVLVMTGLQHAAWRETHRWSSYVFLFLVWAWTCFSLGAVWWQHWAKFWSLLGRTLLLITSAGFVYLAGVCGYLGPTNNPGAGQETYNRFIVLHCFLFPVFLLLCIGLFTWADRRRSR